MRVTPSCGRNATSPSQMSTVSVTLMIYYHERGRPRQPPGPQAPTWPCAQGPHHAQRPERDGVAAHARWHCALRARGVGMCNDSTELTKENACGAFPRALGPVEVP